MGRLIDADKLRKQMSEDYAQNVSKIRNPAVKAIVEKAVETFDGYVVSAETVEAIPIDWIKGYIETCNIFDLRANNVPASKVITTMVKIWEQENQNRGKENGNE